MPLTVVAAGLSKWLDIYSVLMVRVLLNWFPNIPWDRQPLSAIRDVCDPYLNLFRNIIPFVFVVYLSLWEDAASMFSGLLTPNLSWWTLLLTQKYLELDWPFDSGRKKTYLSQERGQRTPKYSDRLWKKRSGRRKWSRGAKRWREHSIES